MPTAGPIPRSALIQLAIVVTVFGGAGPVIALGLAEATPAWLAFWRALLSALTTAMLVGCRGKLARPRPRDWPAVAGVGVFQIGLFFIFLHTALAVVPVGRGVLLCDTTPLWLVPISAFVLGKSVEPRRLLGVSLGLAGVLILANPLEFDWSSARELVAHGLLCSRPRLPGRQRSPSFARARPPRRSPTFCPGSSASPR